ncbi:MAG: DUF4270 domain-containing protein [Phocaeicola sp.]|uniref:DUF4270 domain-containing protein n=1 Tax=Phocaeicola TaxID=909656 RepID=UPI00234EED74|nr:DUF4270 domain-containing protein [Phocaeicola oris]MCE2615621.1 DUF4270 domain-containing protein [Phocaeicola oris]
MKAKYLCALLLAVVGFYSCDDSTPNIGKTTINANDSIPSGVSSYSVITRSLLADSVFARSNTPYLGRYTDPEYGEFSSDFIAQFSCTDDYEFPEEIHEVIGTNLVIRYAKCFGDSTATLRVQIDSLNRVIPEEDKKTYYTSFNPTFYYNKDADPIGVKSLTASGLAVDTIYKGRSWVKSQSVKLDKGIGKHIYNKYLENKRNFHNAETFINNVFKGVYVHSTNGDGCILYIDNIYLGVTYSAYIKSSSGKRDSLVYGSTYFSATKEVIQSNHFKNSEKLKQLAEDNSCTYVKSPAGIVTEATLPIQDIHEEHKRDSLNAAVLSFKCYNDYSSGKYKLGNPKYLLMVRKAEMYTFFEDNKMYDNLTSFVTQYSSATNSYDFKNIAQLVQRCINAKITGEKSDPNWTAKNPDWNKVVLIPISTVEVVESNNNSYYSYYYRSSSPKATIVAVENNLNMNGVKLVGGKDKLTMQVLYTTY